jgi:MoaA/NifB/PqqE/SkfB family radical SAM enzyme
MKSAAWTIGIGFTARCNMRCPFCYSQDQRGVEGLPLETWIYFIQRHAAEVKAINYGTGENPLSRSWYRLAEFVRAYAPDIRQSLTTNGYLAEAIKDEEKRQIVCGCIDEIDVSIDFASAELHDRRRGYPGAFDLAVRTLAYCEAQGKRTTIVVMGEEGSLDPSNLKKLFDLAGGHRALVRLQSLSACQQWVTVP